jgi:hypothetical protein
LDARAVLSDIAQVESPQGKSSLSPARVLVEDIRKYRTTASTLTPEVAANTWIELYDRTFKLTAVPGKAAVEYDPDVRAHLGINSVIAALPPPSAWPALLAAVKKRSSGPDADIRSQTLVLLSEVLVGDRQATDAQLHAIEAAIRNLDPANRIGPRDQLAETRHALVKLYGSPAEIASQFEDDLRKATETSSETGWHSTFEVPDLVTLSGTSEHRIWRFHTTVGTSPGAAEYGHAESSSMGINRFFGCGALVRGNARSFSRYIGSTRVRRGRG